MFRKRLFDWMLIVLVLLLCVAAHAQIETDTRATQIKTVNTPRDFPNIDSKAEWQNRAKEIREQILVSCGLWPMPEKTPLNTHVFGKIVRNGYSIEKVYLQTYPGFYLAGNLYRPLGKGSGPFPGVLNPHGHWENGRMADAKEGSIAARCINFAKQGMVAFSYDMVGFNDTFFPDHGSVETKNFYQRHRRFATNEVNMLWNISLMGLQTWNSIRALDFLASLPDVDKERLACTGESGGGTQTYILGAIDDRLAAQAPVVMVSHTMQGGCSCENVSGLRVDYSNVEVAAAAAPRPQIIVGASGDWTKETMKVEGPSVENIYKLFGSADKLRYVVFDFRHNYNQTSREAVYDFFGKQLHPVTPMSKELPYEKEPDAALRVFPDDKLPSDALPETDFIQSLIKAYRAQLNAMKPTDKKSLHHFKDAMLPAWRHTLQVEIPKTELWSQSIYVNTMSNCVAEKLFLGRNRHGDHISAIYFTPPAERGWRGTVVVLAHPEGKAPYLDKESRPVGLAKALLEKKLGVIVLDTFLTGEAANWEASNMRKQVELFFTTYNRTDTQERVQDLITVATYAKHKRKNPTVLLCGEGRAGLWSLLAAPAADGVVADCCKLDSSSDEELLKDDLFVPGLRKIGDFAGAAMLAAPNPLLLHNCGGKFSDASIKESYATLRSQKNFSASDKKLNEAAISDWVSSR